MITEPDNLDGCFELIDGELFESMGMFASFREAFSHARSLHLTSWEIWLEDELVEARYGGNDQ